MKSLIAFLLSELVLLPLIAGLVRFERIQKSSYQPFFLLIVLAALTEQLSGMLIKVLHATNAVSNNVYALLEWLLIAWQCYAWGLLRTRRSLFYLLVALPCLVWITEDVILREISS